MDTEFVKSVIAEKKLHKKWLDWIIIPPMPKDEDIDDNEDKDDDEDMDDEPEPFAVAFDLGAEGDDCGDGYIVYPKLLVWDGCFTEEHELRFETELVIQDTTFVYTTISDGSCYGSTIYQLIQKRNECEEDIYHYSSSSYDEMPSAFPERLYLKKVDDCEDIYVSNVGVNI